MAARKVLFNGARFGLRVREALHLEDVYENDTDLRLELLTLKEVRVANETLQRQYRKYSAALSAVVDHGRQSSEALIDVARMLRARAEITEEELGQEPVDKYLFSRELREVLVTIGRAERDAHEALSAFSRAVELNMIKPRQSFVKSYASGDFHKKKQAFKEVKRVFKAHQRNEGEELGAMERFELAEARAAYEDAESQLARSSQQMTAENDESMRQTIASFAIQHHAALTRAANALEKVLPLCRTHAVERGSTTAAATAAATTGTAGAASADEMVGTSVNDGVPVSLSLSHRVSRASSADVLNASLQQQQQQQQQMQAHGHSHSLVASAHNRMGVPNDSNASLASLDVPQMQTQLESQRDLLHALIARYWMLASRVAKASERGATAAMSFASSDNTMYYSQYHQHDQQQQQQQRRRQSQQQYHSLPPPLISDSDSYQWLSTLQGQVASLEDELQRERTMAQIMQNDVRKWQTRTARFVIIAWRLAAVRCGTDPAMRAGSLPITPPPTMPPPSQPSRADGDSWHGYRDYVSLVSKRRPPPSQPSRADGDSWHGYRDYVSLVSKRRPPPSRTAAAGPLSWHARFLVKCFQCAVLRTVVERQRERLAEDARVAELVKSDVVADLVRCREQLSSAQAENKRERARRQKMCRELRRRDGNVFTLVRIDPLRKGTGRFVRRREMHAEQHVAPLDSGTVFVVDSSSGARASKRRDDEAREADFDAVLPSCASQSELYDQVRAALQPARHSRNSAGNGGSTATNASSSVSRGRRISSGGSSGSGVDTLHGDAVSDTFDADERRRSASDSTIRASDRQLILLGTSLDGVLYSALGTTHAPGVVRRAVLEYFRGGHYTPLQLNEEEREYHSATAVSNAMERVVQQAHARSATSATVSIRPTAASPPGAALALTVVVLFAPGAPLPHGIADGSASASKGDAGECCCIATVGECDIASVAVVRRAEQIAQLCIGTGGGARDMHELSTTSVTHSRIDQRQYDGKQHEYSGFSGVDATSILAQSHERDGYVYDGDDDDDDDFDRHAGGSDGDVDRPEDDSGSSGSSSGTSADGSDGGHHDDNDDDGIDRRTSLMRSYLLS